MSSDAIVYFNDTFLPKSEVRISPDDRGFLLADGIYEVVRVYDGRPFEEELHLQRLARSLAALRIEGVEPSSFAGITAKLLEANALSDASIYIQVTRGVAPRQHAFPPAGTPATVYATAYAPRIRPENWETGVEAILAPDNRWARCDVKTIALAPNVQASQRAHEAGAEEAIFVRDGAITEGSHTNVCGVLDGVLRTYPRSNYILPGITREVVLELARELGIPTVEEPIFHHELERVDELMILGTSTEVMPIVRLDGRTIGSGEPGPVTRRLQRAFRIRTGRAERAA